MMKSNYSKHITIRWPSFARLVLLSSSPFIIIILGLLIDIELRQQCLFLALGAKKVLVNQEFCRWMNNLIIPEKEPLSPNLPEQEI